jgi:hypothetical protein
LKLGWIVVDESEEFWYHTYFFHLRHWR